ncbi:MAG: class I SAM-dependent methyltransferase [Planctomycetes bacterium]|nr:class I SAM-dependent methyltransferase [Planctomycetota bacterium]
MTTIIVAEPSRKLFNGYQEYLQRLLQELAPRRVGDIGGGRNPQLDADFVRRHKLDYAVLDISAEELARAPDDYRKICVDVGAPDFHLREEFDFVFSRMLAEHVKDGRQFHRNVFAMLKPGGVAFHFFPTLFAAPYLANRLMPEFLSDRTLNLFAPRDRNQQGKFPAYYSWTYGPTRGQLRRLESVGFEVLLYIGGFGHYYYARIPGLKQVSRRMTDLLLKHPNYLVTSYAYLVVRKPPLAEGVSEVSSVIRIPTP